MLTLAITMQSRWHVGTGDGPAETDAAIYRLAGQPAIPLTQVKDLIREHAEAIAATIGLGPDDVDAVFGRPGSTSPTGEWEWTSAVPAGAIPLGSAVSVHHRRDRETGVVPSDGLFDFEVAPAAALAATAGPRDGVPAHLDHVVLVGLAAATVRRVGKRRARGFGRCRIVPSWAGAITGHTGQQAFDLAALVERSSALTPEALR